MGESATRAFLSFRLLTPPLVAACFALLAASLLTVPASAASATLKGIDVSHYQGQPDWGQVKSDGIRFAIAKATEGTTFVDAQYLTNKRRAEAQLLPFTAYHFARPDRSAGDAVAEADFFVHAARLVDDNLVPVLDLESTGGLGTRKLKRWAKDWLNEVHAQLGVKAMIYTSPSFWKANMGNTRWFADNGYRLWVAHWTTANQPTVPAANWGGQGWTLWQYSDCGSVTGISGCVDLDRYNGTNVSPLKIKNNR